MDKSKVVFFYDTCRLCLEKPGINDVFTKTDLVHDIYLCTGVNVAAQEKLPRKICFQCLEIIIHAKQLRILATANDKHLKSLFNDDDLLNKTDQTRTAESTISRKSSTDSDRTIKLETVDPDAFAEEDKSQLKKRKILISFEDSNSEAKKISVRKDLYDSPGAVSSSTKEPVTSIKQNLKVKIKRIKTEGNDCFHYVCDVCQKKFNAWKKYYLHQKTHNRNIICPLDVCGKKFATKGDLEKHVRTHTGERPFSCDLCDKRFAQRGSLKAHKLTVHSQTVSPEKCK